MHIFLEFAISINLSNPDFYQSLYKPLLSVHHPCKVLNDSPPSPSPMGATLLILISQYSLIWLNLGLHECNLP